MKAKNRKVKRMTAIFMAAAMSMTLLAGCGGKSLTEEELSFCQTDIGTLTAPDQMCIRDSPGHVAAGFRRTDHALCQVCV